MGSGDAKGHAKFGDIVAVCDVDSRRTEKAREDSSIGKGKADMYSDYRKVLDRKDIDVVSIVTPDHWHTKIAIEGIDKQVVGQLAADIRAYYPPEPYKAKGVRYVGEHIRRKAGKAFGAGAK